ncbi:MAG: hypothetical protein JRD89_10680 [Deltaproteobacteria bacterium]|nr:hypothetical protein [Deltaproteobacteria bacterium]
MNFKGFDDWIPIFKTGRHTDSARNIREWTEGDLDRIVDKYDPANHEAPIVIGHPEESAPAYGWAEKLKREGGILYAKARDVVPEFADMVKKGLYKKRSISLYPDLTLRHIGFLGATPPAVKGLSNMAFSGGDAVTIEFSDTPSWIWNNIADVFRSIRDWIIEKEGVETADQIIRDWNIEDIRAQANKPEDDVAQVAYREKTNNKEVTTMEFKDKLKGLLGTLGIDVSKIPDDALPGKAPEGSGAVMFSEADIEAAKKKAAADERKKTELEFAEKERKTREDARKEEISTWCEAQVKEGRLTPALVKYGVPEIMNSLASNEDIIEFGEAKEKATMYDRFKALFETELPKLINFGEIATRDTDVSGSGDAGGKLETLTRKKMEGNDKLSYSEAFNAVQRENPDLANEYAAEIRG